MEPTTIENWLKVSTLGAGAFGVVTLWKNNETNDFIAIKRCKANVTEKMRQRWKQEVDLIENSNNSNIVSYKKLPEPLESVLSKCSLLPLLPMEYCSGGCLRYTLCNFENSFGLAENQVKYVLSDISNAISYLHDLNIAHRDIKPENIVLQKCNHRRDNIIYKLIDLGYAKEIGSIGQSTVGTLPYLAPEILTGKKYNKSVDYWSFGVVLYEIVCGEHPFLPTLPVPARLNHIKQKQADHIAIHLQNDNTVTYSSELLSETRINRCLKEKLEKLLRGCFQWDNAKRNQSIFKDLKKILSKRFLTIFSVRNCEYFSYEYDESTLISTLRTWIARETKIYDSEQILLTANNCTNVFPASALIIHYVKEETENCFILFKRNEFINSNIVVPDIIKKLIRFNNVRENWCKAKKYYVQSAYFSYKINNNISGLKQSTVYLSKYLKFIFLQEIERFKSLKVNIEKLLNQCEFINSIEGMLELKQINLNKTFLTILEKQHKLLNDSKKLMDCFRTSERKHKEFQNEVESYRQYANELVNLFNDIDKNNLYDVIINVAHKDSGKENLDCKEIRIKVMNSIKQMDKIKKNDVIVGFIKKVWKMEKYHDIIQDMYIKYENATISKMTNLFTIHIHKLNILCKEIKPDVFLSLTIDYRNHLDADLLQQENRELWISMDKCLKGLYETMKDYHNQFQDNDK